VAVVGTDAPLGTFASLSCPTGATAVAFSPDGKILAAGQWNGKIRLWDAATLAPWVSSPIPAHSDMIFDPAFSPDGKHIATPSKDGTVKIWSPDGLRWVAPRPDR
jgi:WD40 repeat protein